MKWREIFHKADEYSKAKADKTIDDHADPAVQLHQVIVGLQENDQHLRDAAATVIATYKTAKMQLDADVAKAAKLDKQIAALMQQGDETTAQPIAYELSTLQTQIANEQARFDALQQKAEKAKKDVQTNSLNLQAKLQEAKGLGDKIDEAALDHNMNAAIESMNSMNNTSTPSFDQIAGKINQRLAKEESTGELDDSLPGNVDAKANAALVGAQAEDILAKYRTSKTTDIGGEGGGSAGSAS